MVAGLLKRFLRRTDSNIAPMFAVAAIPLIVAMGGAIDYTNSYDQKTVVQDSMDSAALAAGKKIGALTMAELRTDVDNFYYSNVGTRLANPPALQVALQASTITLTTDLVVPTYFLGLIGLTHIDFHVTSQATLAFGTLEVALVLDNSGSMNTNNNIATLRTAATNLVNTIYNLAATSTKPEPVKMGLVSFAAAVNVGSTFQNDAAATWLDKNGVGTYHADAIDGTATTAKAFTLLSGLKDAGGNAVNWGGCVEARAQPYDISDAPATVGTPATMYVPLFAPDEPDNWTCSTGSCSNIGSSSSNRRYLGAVGGTQPYNNYLPDLSRANNCGVGTFTVTKANPAVFTKTSHGLAAGDRVQLDTTGALYSPLNNATWYYVLSTGLTANTFRLSTNSGGTAISTSSAGSQSGTHKLISSRQWTCESGSPNCGGTGNGAAETAAMASTCKYGTPTNQTTISTMTIGGLTGGPNFMCTTDPIAPLTTTKATVTAAIGNMAALGATNIQEGLTWGWHVLSPGAPFTEGRAYGIGDNQKILILMTDGENTYYPQSKYVGTWYAAWGYIYKNHLGTTSTNQATEEAKMDERTALACANIKGAAIKVYTVAFTGSGGINIATQDMLKACASDPSMFYLAADQAALLAAFRAIGDQLSLLRISH